jgi:hypothetical protein
VTCLLFVIIIGRVGLPNAVPLGCGRPSAAVRQLQRLWPSDASKPILVHLDYFDRFAANTKA